MLPKLYTDLVPWYRLVDPPEDHADEAASYRRALEGAVAPRLSTLLELGAGAGHNALHLKHGLRCTLTDLSPDMLRLSRELNPECEHMQGDMRSLRLERSFDAVLVHDAITYMVSEQELSAVARTAFVHTRPGGAAVFAPDHLADTFREQSQMAETEEPGGKRAVRYLEWTWDPDPSDTAYCVEYAFMLREHGDVRVVHDRHVEGLFSLATWRRILSSAGYEVQTFERCLGDEQGSDDTCFLCRRPA